MREAIIRGMAEILWGLAWADHVEEAGCRGPSGLSGVEITDVMPEIPARAFEHAEKIGAEYEKLNGCGLPALLQRAENADKWYSRAIPENRKGPERFGNCLAFMATGHGVSWFDDHAEFDLKTPRYDGGEVEVDLRFLAEDTCEECEKGREEDRKETQE